MPPPRHSAVTERRGGHRALDPSIPGRPRAVFFVPPLWCGFSRVDSAQRATLSDQHALNAKQRYGNVMSATRNTGSKRGTARAFAAKTREHGCSTCCQGHVLTSNVACIATVSVHACMHLSLSTLSRPAYFSFQPKLNELWLLTGGANEQHARAQCLEPTICKSSDIVH